jgi:hypothetical protein
LFFTFFFSFFTSLFHLKPHKQQIANHMDALIDDPAGPTPAVAASASPSNALRNSPTSQARSPASPATPPARKRKRKEEPVVRIASGHAKTQYKLTDADLATIEVRLAENPHSPSFAPMRLYDEDEVKRLAVVVQVSGVSVETDGWEILHSW